MIRGRLYRSRPNSFDSVLPRIQHPHAGSFEVRDVPGNHPQVVQSRNRGDEEIWLAESGASLPPPGDEPAPVENDVFVDCKDPSGEPGPKRPVEPRGKCRSKRIVRMPLDAVTNS